MTLYGSCFDYLVKEQNEVDNEGQGQGDELEVVEVTSQHALESSSKC